MHKLTPTRKQTASSGLRQANSQTPARSTVTVNVSGNSLLFLLLSCFSLAFCRCEMKWIPLRLTGCCELTYRNRWFLSPNIVFLNVLRLWFGAQGSVAGANKSYDWGYEFWNIQANNICSFISLFKSLSLRQVIYFTSLR